MDFVVAAVDEDDDDDKDHLEGAVFFCVKHAAYAVLDRESV